MEKKVRERERERERERIIKKGSKVNYLSLKFHDLASFKQRIKKDSGEGARKSSKKKFQFKRK